MIDSSFSVSNTSSVISGFMTVRAPKGEKRAMYFGPGNSSAIDAMIGVGSADWPDILEAQSFNAEYGLYISAPSGTSDIYPSHLGGFYITKFGLFKFYKVTDKESPNYLIDLFPGTEDDYISNINKSKIVIESSLFDDYSTNDSWLVLKKGESPSGSLDIQGISNSIYNKLGGLDFDDPTAAYTTVETIQDISGQFMDDENENHIFKINMNDGVYDFTLLRLIDGANNELDVETHTFDIKTFIGRIDDTRTGEGTGAYLIDKIIEHSKPEDVSKHVFTLLTEGTVKFISNKDGIEIIYTIPIIINELFHQLINVQDDTFVYFMQKSKTEKQTQIQLTDITYDKWFYDQCLPVFPGSLSDKSDPSSQTWPDWEFKSTDPEYAIFDYVEDHIDTKYKIGQLTSKQIGTSTIYYYADATENFATKFIVFGESITVEDKKISGFTQLSKDNVLYHNVFYVDDLNIKKLLTEDELIAKYGEQEGKKAYTNGLINNGQNVTVAVKNNKFNSITLTSSEEVYTGSMTSGGTITGSLDENGKDTYGSTNYFPTVLTDDDFSFIEVRVLQKFDDDSSNFENGFWVYKRALDPYSIDSFKGSQESITFNIEGDRWSSVVQLLNLSEKRLGCAWREEWYPIVLDGLKEALNPDYDDSWLFMECTGQDVFKTNIFDIRKKQKMATVISPKLLTVSGSENIFTKSMAERTVVFGRIEGTAQYAGEFLVYDAISKKKYYRLPIGDIGCNLARIMDLRLGGMPPAWTNSTGGLGGQLKGSCIKAKYSFEDDATQVLDIKGINPIAFTSDDGLMILSQKNTAPDINSISDWSFLGHSMSFDIVKREIRDNVMRQQIMKPINEYWMDIRLKQTNDILSKRTAGDDPIWTSAEANIIDQNTQLTKTAKNFVIKVSVRVTPTAETVTLILNNLAQ